MRIGIIGAGLGGLECGYLLAQKGFEVFILEKNAQIGGSLQSFVRNGLRFDTGFHYVGGLAEGELLNQLFAQFDLLKLPWHQLDTDCFDEVFWNGKSYGFANGYENFAENLSEKFPGQRDALRKYVDFLQKSQTSLSDLSSDGSKVAELMARPAYPYLQEVFADELLRDVVAGTSLKMELRAESLPLYIYSQINGSFIQSAWRLKGGGQQIADSLARDIQSFGGQVLTKKQVTGFTERDGSLVGIDCADGEHFECDAVISDIHPTALLAMLPEGIVRNHYKQRISGLANSFGVFTVNLSLKEGAVAYRNRNLFVHENADLWGLRAADDRIQSVGVHFAVPESGRFASNIDLFFPMQWSEVARWAGSSVGRRGDDYERFKQRKAEEAIRFVLPYIPDLQGNILKIHTSSPLTYRDYTATSEGSAYGIRKDCEHLAVTMIPTRTPVPNLFFTGQNVNFHGVLGVTITSLLTVRQFLSAIQ